MFQIIRKFAFINAAVKMFVNQIWENIKKFVCLTNFCIVLIISNIMVIYMFTYHMYLIPDPERENEWSRVCLSRGVHTSNPQRRHHSWCRVETFVLSDALKMHSLALCVVRFLSKLFSKLFILLMDDFQRIHIFINKICMAINLWSALRWRDTASSTEGITQR